MKIIICLSDVNVCIKDLTQLDKKIYRATKSSHRKFLFRGLLGRVRGSPCVGLLTASRMYVRVEVTVYGPTVQGREYGQEGLRTA